VKSLANDSQQPAQVAGWDLENSCVQRRMKGLGRSERGEGKLKALIYTAFLVLGVYVAVKVVPLYVSDYQLKDKISEQARFAVVNRYTEDQIRDNIFKVIQDLDIPAQREDVKVAKTNHGIVISVNYTVPVDFVMYKTELNFSPASEGIDILK
jgi:hypothetical protein